MAITPVQINYDLSGFTTPTLLVLDADAANTTILNNLAAGNVMALTTQGRHAWKASVTDALTGIHRIVITDTDKDGDTIVDGWAYLADTTDVVWVHDTLAGAMAEADQAAVLAAIPSPAEIEAALVNEGDATAFLQAVADKIASDLTSGDVTAAAIASAVRTNLATELARIDVAVSSVAGGDASAANQNTILAKMLAYTQLLARKDAGIKTDNATEFTAINADGGSGAGAYDNTTDSQEANADELPSAYLRIHTHYDPQADKQQFTIWIEDGTQLIDLASDVSVDCDLTIQEFGAGAAHFTILNQDKTKVVNKRYELEQANPNLTSGKSYEVLGVITYQGKNYEGAVQFSFWGP